MIEKYCRHCGGLLREATAEELAQPIRTVILPGRVRDALIACGATTLGSAAQITRGELLRGYNVGTVTAKEVERTLAHLGVILGGG